MKKVLGLICVIVLCLLCLSACGEIDLDKTACDVLNTLVAKETDNLSLTVKTTTAEDTLNSSYNVTKSNDTYTVTYSYEKLNGYEEVDGVIVPPTEYKSTVQGSMKVKDGIIIEQDGTSANITLETLSISGLSFNKSYFTNISNQDGSFKADVVDIEGFIGTDVNTSNMKVEVYYSVNNISSIKITYSTSTSSVELLYVLG